MFYATLGAQFGGMFIFRYRLELVLLAPFIAGLFAWYVHISYKPESATQHPERLYREAGPVRLPGGLPAPVRPADVRPHPLAVRVVHRGTGHRRAILGNLGPLAPLARALPRGPFGPPRAL